MPTKILTKITANHLKNVAILTTSHIGKQLAIGIPPITPETISGKCAQYAHLPEIVSLLYYVNEQLLRTFYLTHDKHEEYDKD